MKMRKDDRILNALLINDWMAMLLMTEDMECKRENWRGSGRLFMSTQM